MRDEKRDNRSNPHAPGPLAFQPACVHCACKEWRYGFVFVNGVRIARKLCAKCDVPWLLPEEAEANEFDVPDPVLVLDYTRPVRPRLIEAALPVMMISPQLGLFR